MNGLVDHNFRPDSILKVLINSFGEQNVPLIRNSVGLILKSPHEIKNEEFLRLRYCFT